MTRQPEEVTTLAMSVDWAHYPATGAYDELLAPGAQARPGAGVTLHYLHALADEEMHARCEAASLAMQIMGITFTLGSDSGAGAIDRVWPFDVIPRIIPASEWRRTEAGLRQRLQALNLFIADIYDRQQIIRDGVLPAEVLAQSANYRPVCVGIKPRYGVWAHICGSDLVRDCNRPMSVLEDNLRIPSGASYMLENRLVMKRVFPELFQDHSILPVDGYPSQLFDMLASLSPRPGEYPAIVVLSPGIYNSAYFEHAYIARQMGVELVTGKDLVVDDDIVYMKTIAGRRRVDVIYRRVDDLYLDPSVFNPQSLIGVRGLMRAWARNNVAIANAPGAGVADDKVVYAFVPDMIRYYLDQAPILENVPTYLCMDPLQRDHVLENLDKLVVKPANESGGYGIMIGPAASRRERMRFAALIRKNPRNYIAQPTLNLSTVPTHCGDRIEPRHVDLRPFILSGETQQVTHGGLTRVALRKGSLEVNSSQGGGSKDTWIVETEGR
jgi:uncharacterized circularly permuted ATP-grasp superfamily protein